MRLSKQERIAVLIILAIVVLALGAFLIVKPAIESYNSTRTTLTAKTEERDKLVARRDTKKGLREQIEDAYKEGEHLADMFFPEFRAYEADEAFREFLAQCKSNVVVESVTVSEPTTATLEAVFFTPATVEYALKTYATSGVEPTEEEAKIAERMEALRTALSESQTIGASTVEFKVAAKMREDLITFADEINNYVIKEAGGDTRKAIMLNGIELEYEEVNNRYDALIDENKEFMDAEGQAALAAEIGVNVPDVPTNPDEPGNEDDKGEAALSAYLVTLESSVTFYSIERMQDPKKQLDLQDGITTPAQ